MQKQLQIVTGKQKLKVLNQLIAADTSAKALEYYRESMQIATTLRDITGQVQAVCALGNHYSGKQEFDSAIYYYTESLNRSKKYGLLHEQVNCLENIADTYNKLFQYDKELVFRNEALSVSRKENNPKDIAMALEELGVFYLDDRNYNQALIYFNEQMKYDELMKDSSSIAACYGNIGTLYLNKGDYTNSILAYKKAMQIKQRFQDKNAIAQCQLNIGIAYKEQGNYALALEHMLEAARYFDQSKSFKEQASCYNTIGNIQIELNNTDNALEYHFKALHIREKINYRKGIAGSLTNLGETYMKQGKYDTATRFLDSSLIVKNEIGDKVLIASTLDLLGEVNYLKKDFPAAESYYLQSLDLKEQVEDPKGKAVTLNNLGELYLAWEKPDMALDRLQEGRIILEQVKAKKTLLENYDITTKVFRAKNDMKNAMLFYDQYTALKDTLLSDQKNKALAEMQVKYETEKKEQEILLLNERDKAQAAVVDRQHKLIYSLGGGAILLIAVILLLFSAYRSRRTAFRQSQIIIEQKQTIIEQKQTMLSELHHRIKNNLQILSTLLDLQQSRINDPYAQDLMKAVEHRLNAMLLIHRNLYGEQVGPQVNMNEYLANLSESLSSSFGYSRQNMDLKLDVQNILVDADKALSIGFICNEIISNSFKHAFHQNDRATLSVSFTEKKNDFHLVISDNGRGMPEGIDMKHADSFGVRLIHLFAQDLRGNITIESNHRGTSITLILPNQNIHT